MPVSCLTDWHYIINDGHYFLRTGETPTDVLYEALTFLTRVLLCSESPLIRWYVTHSIQ